MWHWPGGIVWGIQQRDIPSLVVWASVGGLQLSLLISNDPTSSTVKLVTQTNNVTYSEYRYISLPANRIHQNVSHSHTIQSHILTVLPVGSLPRPVCAGCGQWLVWPAAPGPWQERTRGGLTAGLPAWPPAFGVHDDALYKSTAFTFLPFYQLYREACNTDE